MRAVTQDTYGSVDVLKPGEIEKPSIGDDQVLIRVAAASVNPLDWHIMRGRPFLVRFVAGLRKPKQPVRGVDVAGQVEAIGLGVTRFQPGDDVFGWCEAAFAEYASAREGSVVPKPSGLGHAEAAAVPVAGFTALQGLRDLGRIEPGHRVLIIGASGGVGTFAVQIAKSFQAEVTGVCSTRNLEMVAGLGADHVIDYTNSGLTAGGQKYDIIFQLAGTASPLKLRRQLTTKGTLVLSSGMGRLGGLDRLLKALVSSRFVSQRLVTWVAKNSHDDLVFLADLIEAGKLTPIIDRRYALSETAEAIKFVEEGHTRGKVVITP